MGICHSGNLRFHSDLKIELAIELKLKIVISLHLSVIMGKNGNINLKGDSWQCLIVMYYSPAINVE